MELIKDYARNYDDDQDTDFQPDDNQAIGGLPNYNATENPGDILASISREQAADYQDRFRPIEQDWINRVMDEGRITDNVNLGMENVGKSYGIAKKETNRNLSRYGLDAAMTPEQKQAMDRLRKFNQGKSEVAVADSVREGAYTDRLNALNAVSGFGHDLVSSSSDAAAQAAGMQSAREQQNDVMGEQRRQQQIGTAISTIAIIAMVAMCSEQYKENIQPVDDSAMLEAVQLIDVMEYDYKPGVAFNLGHHIGAIAENVPDQFKTMDENGIAMNSVVFALVGANKALLKRVEELEASVNG